MSEANADVLSYAEACNGRLAVKTPKGPPGLSDSGYTKGQEQQIAILI